MDAPVVTVKTQKKNGKKLPVIHILMPDGRVTEFKSLAVVIPEGDSPDGMLDVFAIPTSSSLSMKSPNGQVAHSPPSRGRWQMVNSRERSKPGSAPCESA